MFPASDVHPEQLAIQICPFLELEPRVLLRNVEEVADQRLPWTLRWIASLTCTGPCLTHLKDRVGVLRRLGMKGVKRVDASRQWRRCPAELR